MPSSDGSSCILTSKEFQEKTAEPPQRFGFAFDDEVTHASSGDKHFDRAYAITLLKLSKTFNVLPSFVFFREKPDVGRNAYASPERLSANSPRDVSMAYGLNLMGDQLKGAYGGIPGIVGVTAHEFGHLLQFRTGIAEQLRLPNGNYFRGELHADYLAGYYLAIRAEENSGFNASEVISTFGMMGDESYNRPGHHGTNAQRLQAISLGYRLYKDNRMNFSDAIQSGLNHVNSVRQGG